MLVRIEFEPSNHTYTIDGAPAISVTQVMDGRVTGYDGIPAHILEAAAHFGNAVDLACQLIAENDLDESTLDPLMVPRVNAFKQFLADKNVEIISHQTRVADKRLMVAGTLDFIMKFDRCLWVIDTKATSSVMPSWTVQTSAYAKFYADMHGCKNIKRAALWLRDDGRYKLDIHKDVSDYNVFLSCLNIHRWRQRHYG
jgi:hypothetical protein